MSKPLAFDPVLADCSLSLSDLVYHQFTTDPCQCDTRRFIYHADCNCFEIKPIPVMSGLQPLLSAHQYFRILYTEQDPETGFYADACYAVTAAGEPVSSLPATVFLVFRGSDDWHDWENNVWGIFLSLGPVQARQALCFHDTVLAEVLPQMARSYPQFQPHQVRIVTAGHSLGGGLAGLVASAFGYSGFTFNAAPMKQFTGWESLAPWFSKPPREGNPIEAFGTREDILPNTATDRQFCAVRWLSSFAANALNNAIDPAKPNQFHLPAPPLLARHMSALFSVETTGTQTGDVGFPDELIAHSLHNFYGRLTQAELDVSLTHYPEQQTLQRLGHGVGQLFCREVLQL